MNEISAKKKEFEKQIRSEHKRQIFERQRLRLKRAIGDEDYDEIHEAEILLMKLFHDRQQYEYTMYLYEEYLKQEQKYRQWQEQLEQQSINLEKIEIKKQYEKKKKQLEQMLRDQQL